MFYRDLDQTEFSAKRGQRLFNMFYLIFATVYVANALSLIGKLRADVERVRNKFAWKRRGTNKALITEITPGGDEVTAYEFVVASLVQLDKATAEDIEVSVVAL
jgi:hypothetical protein